MGDVFSFSSESNRRSLRQSLEIIEKEGRGALVYLRLKKTEESLLDEIEQLTGHYNAETYEKADIKDFGLGDQIVADLGISEVRLLTNHPKVFVGLSGYGIKIREHVKIQD